eukprot:scaffold166845_cov22-Tisochrysis_lutea.AAC.4
MRGYNAINHTDIIQMYCHPIGLAASHVLPMSAGNTACRTGMTAWPCHRHCHACLLYDADATTTLLCPCRSADMDKLKKHLALLAVLPGGAATAAAVDAARSGTEAGVAESKPMRI